MTRNNKVDAESSVKLLGISTDNQLSFNQQISYSCKSVSNQLNALERLKNFLGFKLNFSYQILFIVRLFGLSCQLNQ